MNWQKGQKQSNKNFRHRELTIEVIMDCRKIVANKFRTRLGFKQYDAIFTKDKT